MSETAPFIRRKNERSSAYYILIVLVIALVVGNANFEFTLISGAFPNIAVAFHTTQVLLVITVVFVASLVFLPITGALADTYGKKRLLLAVCVLFAIGSVLCAVAPVYWLFLTGRVLQSLFVVSYVASRDDLRRRGGSDPAGGTGADPPDPWRHEPRARLVRVSGIDVSERKIPDGVRVRLYRGAAPPAPVAGPRSSPLMLAAGRPPGRPLPRHRWRAAGRAALPG